MTEAEPTATTAPTLIGSVQRALRLLEAAAGHEGGAPAKQLAREAALPLPTAYHLLRTLAHEGYLERVEGLYYLGEAASRLTYGKVQQKRRSKIIESLSHWRDTIGAPVYFAVYREGEIDVVAVAESDNRPAVDQWADFKATAHAHAIGQCLLAQLDVEARQDHLARHPVEAITPYSVGDKRSLLQRLAEQSRMQPVIEREEYSLGTVCAALPITAGGTAATMAISYPLHQRDKLRPSIETLRGEVGGLLSSLSFSISI